eukprot:TRINITY_DN61927_c0_g1_i5.p1 TRINITY_DN61927_c0_g1~~TRINITY_DN61927_c0_g1_i5.p1  ORF type:complete len:212 (+),score=-19.68 TRINITY_DN61927_c0_g1_i5:585-1220(+)
MKITSKYYPYYRSTTSYYCFQNKIANYISMQTKLLHQQNYRKAYLRLVDPNYVLKGSTEKYHKIQSSTNHIKVDNYLDFTTITILPTLSSSNYLPKHCSHSWHHQEELCFHKHQPLPHDYQTPRSAYLCILQPNQLKQPVSFFHNHSKPMLDIYPKQYPYYHYHNLTLVLDLHWTPNTYESANPQLNLFHLLTWPKTYPHYILSDLARQQY